MAKFVFFDLWNTLVYNTTYEVTEELAERYSFPESFDPKLFLHETVKPLMTINYDVDEEFFRDLFAEWGRETSDQELKEIIDLWKHRLDGAYVFPETVEVLETLSESFQLVLISNLTYHALNVFQERFNLERFFPQHVYSCAEGVMKPEKEIFDLALSRCQAQPEEVVFVGDSYELDVEGPKNAGLRAVWLNRRNRNPPENPRFKPDAVINNLSELIPLL
ncbi:HAD family hydrolase [Candidatus Altiarchaeota archaeon]